MTTGRINQVRNYILKGPGLRRGPVPTGFCVELKNTRTSRHPVTGANSDQISCWSILLPGVTCTTHPQKALFLRSLTACTTASCDYYQFSFNTTILTFEPPERCAGQRESSRSCINCVSNPSTTPNWVEQSVSTAHVTTLLASRAPYKSWSERTKTPWRHMYVPKFPTCPRKCKKSIPTPNWGSSSPLITHICRQRPYSVECSRSHPNSAVNRHKARSVLGWGTAWEALRVPLAFLFLCQV